MLKIASLLTLALALSPMATISADQNFPLPEVDYETQKKDPGTKAVVSFSYPVIHVWGRNRVRVLTNKAEFNTAAPWMWKMEQAEESYIQFIVEFNRADLVKNWYFNVKECCAIGTPRDDQWPRKERWLEDDEYFRSPAFFSPYACPIEISVNGYVVAENFEPLFGHSETHYGWRMDHFIIPKERLHSGENMVQIRLQDNRRGYGGYYRYAIEGITLTDTPAHVWILPHTL